MPKLAQNRRHFKQEMKILMRAGEHAGQSQISLFFGAQAANKLLEERELSKIEASKQWRASHMSDASQ